MSDTGPVDPPWDVTLDPDAQDEVKQAMAYIAADDPLEALRWQDGFFELIDELAAFPSGMAMPAKLAAAMFARCDITRIASSTRPMRFAVRCASSASFKLRGTCKSLASAQSPSRLLARP